jgi:hypothetical protein
MTGLIGYGGAFGAINDAHLLLMLNAHEGMYVTGTTATDRMRPRIRPESRDEVVNFRYVSPLLGVCKPMERDQSRPQGENA